MKSRDNRIFLSKKPTDWVNQGRGVRSTPFDHWVKIDQRSSQIEQTRLKPECLPCQFVIGKKSKKAVFDGENKQNVRIDSIGANLERILQY